MNIKSNSRDDIVHEANPDDEDNITAFGSTHKRDQSNTRNKRPFRNNESASCKYK